MKLVRFFILLLLFISCSAQKEDRTVWKGSEFLTLHRENKLPKNSGIYTVEIESFYDVSGDFISKFEISKDLCKSLFVHCIAEKKTLHLNSGIGAKYNLVAKVEIRENSKPEIVKIISLNEIEKNEYEKRCKIPSMEKRISYKQPVAIHESFLLDTGNSAFFRMISPNKFVMLIPSERAKIDSSKEFKIKEIRFGLADVVQSDKRNFYQVSENVWVQYSALKINLTSCTLSDRLNTDEILKLRIKESYALTDDTGKHLGSSDLGELTCSKDSNSSRVSCLAGTHKFSLGLSDIEKKLELVQPKESLKKSRTLANEYEMRATKFYQVDNIKKANEYFEKACDLDAKISCYQLGLFHAREKLNDEMGLRYYRKACELGLYQGCGNAGGILVKSNLEGRKQAKELYSKACRMSDKYSCIVASRLDSILKKNPNIGYESLFEQVYPEIINEMKKNGNFEGSIRQKI